MAGTGAEEPAGTGALTLPHPLSLAGTGSEGTPLAASGALTLPHPLQIAGSGGTHAEGTGGLTLPHPLVVDGGGQLKFESATSGPGAIQLYDANGVLQAMLPVVTWETHRKINAVGEWKASLPATALIDGAPLSTVVTGGWKADLLQQSVWAYNLPNLPYLMYHGVVEDIGFEVDESGVALCNLSGSFRGIALAGLVTPTTASYSEETFADVLNDIEDDEMGGIISFPPNYDRTVSLGFNTVQADTNTSASNNGILPRMVRMNRVAELARWAWRETWDQDRPEFIAIDAVPRTQYWFINQEAAGPRGFDAGKSNLGLIAGTPSFRREGRGVINRIIAFGGDLYETVDLEAEAGAQLAGDRYGLPPDTAVVPTIVMDTQPVPIRTLTIEGVTYSFVTGATDASGHVGVGSNVSDARQALKDAISGDDGFNTSHPRIYLGDWSGDTAVIYFRLSPRPDNEIDWSGTFSSDGGNTINIGSPDANTATKTTTRPLTLEFATKTVPFIPQEGTNPDGTSYWYLEDGTSVGLFGPRETVIQRGDIRAAAATDESREAAANVLYLVTYSQLLKQSSPIRYADVAIANGASVWALPGDAVTVRYVGNVTLDGAVTTWMELSDLWIVIERNDRMTDAGVREVSFKIAQPEITIEIPELQEALGLTQNGTDGDGNVLLNNGDGSTEGSSGSTGVGSPGTLPDYDPGPGPVFTGAGIPNGPGQGPVFPGGGGSLFPGCCAPPDTITGISDPPDGGGGGDTPASASLIHQVFNPSFGPFVTVTSPFEIDMTEVGAGLESSSGRIFVGVASQGAYDGGEGVGILTGYGDMYPPEPTIDGFDLVETVRFRGYADGYYNFVPPFEEHAATEDEVRLSVLSMEFGPGEIPATISVDAGMDAGTNLFVYVVALPLEDNDIASDSYTVNRPSTAGTSIGIFAPSSGRRVLVFSTGNFFCYRTGAGFQYPTVETIDSVNGGTLLANLQSPLLPDEGVPTNGGFLARMTVHLGPVDGDGPVVNINARPANGPQPEAPDDLQEPAYHLPLWTYVVEDEEWVEAYPNGGAYLGAGVIAIEIAGPA